MQVTGLDVAVDDALAVQPPERSRDGSRACDDIGDRERLLFREQLFECPTLVPIEHRVKRRCIRDLAHSHELVRAVRGDPQPQPRLVREHRNFFWVACARLV